MKLYPLKFTPVLSYHIQGVEKLKTELNKECTLDSIGESWEISDIEKSKTFYIPTGRVHAIGAGFLLAENQQTYNITYRVFDYDRVDKKTGSKRELHNYLALDAIDF